MHAEQIRWTAIYNYLVASTVFLLAWATIFSGGSRGALSRLLLVVFAVVGLLLSLIWAVLGYRASRLAASYSRLGRKIETDHGVSVDQAPFLAANAWHVRLPWWSRLVRTGYLSMAIPVIFAALYVVLLVGFLTQADTTQSKAVQPSDAVLPTAFPAQSPLPVER